MMDELERLLAWMVLRAAVHAIHTTFENQMRSGYDVWQTLKLKEAYSVTNAAHTRKYGYSMQRWRTVLTLDEANTTMQSAIGDCSWKECPQLRDNEPYNSGRHCPLDILEDEE